MFMSASGKRKRMSGLSKFNRLCRNPTFKISIYTVVSIVWLAILFFVWRAMDGEGLIFITFMAAFAVAVASVLFGGIGVILRISRVQYQKVLRDGINRNYPWSPAFQGFRVIGYSLIIAGLLVGITSVVGSDFLPKRSSVFWRLPLTNIEDFDVDSQGRMYCLLPLSGRIQVYSPSGKYLHNWYVDVQHISRYRIRLLIKGDRVYILFARKKGIVLVYDLWGRLLSEKKTVEEIEVLLEDKSIRKAIDASGRNYEVRNTTFAPHVVMMNDNITERIVIEDPFAIWIFHSYFAVLLIVAGTALESIASWMLKRWYNIHVKS